MLMRIKKATKRQRPSQVKDRMSKEGWGIARADERGTHISMGDMPWLDVCFRILLW